MLWDRKCSVKCKRSFKYHYPVTDNNRKCTFLGLVGFVVWGVFICLGFVLRLFVCLFANPINSYNKQNTKKPQPKSKSALQNVFYTCHCIADSFSDVWLLCDLVNTTFCRQSMLHWPWCLLLMVLPQWTPVCVNFSTADLVNAEFAG